MIIYLIKIAFFSLLKQTETAILNKDVKKIIFDDAECIIL